MDVAHLPPAISRLDAGLLPQRERRRQVAEDLYHALVHGGYSFWEHIHPLFFRRDITRHDMRELIRRGLATTRGNYRALLQLFGMPAGDYKRFMNFLATHDCGADFREFRNADADLSSPRWSSLSILPPLRNGKEPAASDSKSKKIAS